MIQVCWKGLPHAEDTVEALSHVYEDVTKITLRLIVRKNTNKDLAEKACAALAL